MAIILSQPAVAPPKRQTIHRDEGENILQFKTIMVRYSLNRREKLIRRLRRAKRERLFLRGRIQRMREKRESIKEESG